MKLTTKAVLALTVTAMVGGNLFNLGQTASAADNVQPQPAPPSTDRPAQPPTTRPVLVQPGAGAGVWRAPAGSLDRSQYAAFYSAVQANSNEIAALQAKITAAQKELVEATLAENFDQNVVRAKTEALLKLQGEMILIRANALATLAPTLKPEQREQLVNTSGAMMLTSGFMSYYGWGGAAQGAPASGAPGAVWSVRPGATPGQPQAVPLNPGTTARALPLEPNPNPTRPR
jgi:Spy/CpxP family protein refolding chaperone